MAEGQGVIRRKVAAAKAELPEGGPGADRGWRLALARAARDQLKLDLEVQTLGLTRRSLGEVIELAPERRWSRCWKDRERRWARSCWRRRC